MNLFLFCVIFFIKKWSFPAKTATEVCRFSLSVSSSTLLTPFLLTIFVSAEPCQSILSSDRSEPRFKSHTGGKIRITLKNNKNFDIFC